MQPLPPLPPSALSPPPPPPARPGPSAQLASVRFRSSGSAGPESCAGSMCRRAGAARNSALAGVLTRPSYSTCGKALWPPQKGLAGGSVPSQGSSGAAEGGLPAAVASAAAPTAAPQRDRAEFTRERGGAPSAPKLQLSAPQACASATALPARGTPPPAPPPRRPCPIPPAGMKARPEVPARSVFTALPARSVFTALPARSVFTALPARSAFTALRLDWRSNASGGRADRCIRLTLISGPLRGSPRAKRHKCEAWSGSAHDPVSAKPPPAHALLPPPRRPSPPSLSLSLDELPAPSTSVINQGSSGGDGTLSPAEGSTPAHPSSATSPSGTGACGLGSHGGDSESGASSPPLSVWHAPIWHAPNRDGAPSQPPAPAAPATPEQALGARAIGSALHPDSPSATSTPARLRAAAAGLDPSLDTSLDLSFLSMPLETSLDVSLDMSLAAAFFRAPAPTTWGLPFPLFFVFFTALPEPPSSDGAPPSDPSESPSRSVPAKRSSCSAACTAPELGREEGNPPPLHVNLPLAPVPHRTPQEPKTPAHPPPQ
eukprot:scaffold13189_cov103-Isochrysis_galbana.AAC.6